MKWRNIFHTYHIAGYIVVVLVGAGALVLLRVSSGSVIPAGGMFAVLRRSSFDPAAGSDDGDLTRPDSKEIAMQLVSSAENSTLDWKSQFGYIEDIGDGRGYTAGIIGFCSGTGDMIDLVNAYTKAEPGNVLASFLPALRAVNGTASHTGLGQPFVTAWRTAAADRLFQEAQQSERDRLYFNPAVSSAKADGLGALGQFAYYDAAVMHGADGLADIRRQAIKSAVVPAAGGNQKVYLKSFLIARKTAMRQEDSHYDTSRVDDEQLRFLRMGKLNLAPPLDWTVYGDHYAIPGNAGR